MQRSQRHRRLRELGAKSSAIQRYEQVLTHLAPFDELVRSKILNAGPPTALTRYLLELQVPVTSTSDQDLRGRLTYADKQFDFVICTEVLERLHDCEDSPRDTWTFSGMIACLSELRRVGKRLLLSTPNVCSWRAVKRLLNGRHPYEYVPHVRELAPRDVRNLLTQTGWKEDRIWTEDCWGGVSSPLAKRMAALCNRTSMRGDVIYAKAN